MKNLWIRISIITMILLLVGCSGKKSYEELLAASWFAEGDSEPAFTLYSDGTCEIDGEYGIGKWSIVNDNQLKLTNYYGETETATIVDIVDGCLTLDRGTGDLMLYWNTSEQSSGVTDKENNNTEVKASLEGLYINSCSDGVAWIKWEDDQANKHYGFMNLDGEIYFELVTKFNDYERGPIVDGYTYVQSDGNFVLLKTDGTITYQEINETDDNAYYILASGDGFFLVKERISNMTENVEKIGVIDSSGKWKVELMSPENYISEERFKQSGADGYQYCGEGVFSIDYATNGDNTHLFVSAENQNIFEISEIGRITSFYNGELLCQSFDGGTSGGHLGKIQKITTNGDIIEFPVDGNLISSNEGHVVIAQESKSYEYDRLFIYNIGGELEKDLSEYSAYNYTPYFDKGYLTFLINGADGLLYIATIDAKTMNFSFQPSVIENMFTVFYDKQAIVTLKDDDSACIDLKTGEINKLPFNISNSTNANLYEGIIALEETEKIKFYNWDGQEIIPTLK